MLRSRIEPFLLSGGGVPGGWIEDLVLAEDEVLPDILESTPVIEDMEGLFDMSSIDGVSDSRFFFASS